MSSALAQQSATEADADVADQAAAHACHIGDAHDEAVFQVMEGGPGVYLGLVEDADASDEGGGEDRSLLGAQLNGVARDRQLKRVTARVELAEVQHHLAGSEQQPLTAEEDVLGVALLRRFADRFVLRRVLRRGRRREPGQELQHRKEREPAPPARHQSSHVYLAECGSWSSGAPIVNSSRAAMISG